MLAAKTALPVIGVPIPTQHLGGLDSLLSIVQMPRGIPVATVAIGNATNAGLLAAAILALGDPALAERLAAWRARQTEGRPRRPVERRDLSVAPAERGLPGRAGRPWPARARRCSRRCKPRSSAVLSTTRTTIAATGAPVDRDGDRPEDDRHVQHDQPAVRREHLRRAADVRWYSPLPMKLNRYETPWLMTSATTANRIVARSPAPARGPTPVGFSAREQRQRQHEDAVDRPRRCRSA